MAAGSTYTPIATTTLSGGTSTVTFSSIAGTYTDLILVGANIGYVSVGNTPFLRINGDTATNYSGTLLEGNGSAAQSGRRTNSSQGIPLGGTFLGSSTTVATNFILHLMNYSNATTYKSGLSRYWQPAGEVEATVGLWRNTSAITSIEYRTDGGGTISAGAVFTLYGIAAA